MKILITGFDPFGGESKNPSFEAVKLLPEEIEGAEIIKLEIPTVFGKGGDVLTENIKEHRPDAVICVGQAGGRAKITVEKVAINLMEARIPDNEGKQPFDTPIVEGGATAYFASLPVKPMVKAMNDAGIPSAVSYTAGTFVCNELMYRTLHHIDSTGKNMIGGFIHVPYLPEQASKLGDVPSMSLRDIASGLEIGIRTIINGVSLDGQVIAGELH